MSDIGFWSVVAFVLSIAGILLSIAVAVFSGWAMIRTQRGTTVRRLLDAILFTSLAVLVTRGLSLLGVEEDFVLAMWRLTICGFLMVCLLMIQHTTKLGPDFIEAMRRTARQAGAKIRSR